LLRGHYPASSLLRTHPPPSRRRSISRLRRLYDLPFSGDFSPGRGGLLQLLGMSLPPCCRFHPAEVKVPRRPDFGTPCCLRPSVAGSAFGSTHFRGHLRVHCCYSPVTRNLPLGDLVDRLQSLGFPPPCYPSYGAPDSCPGRPKSCWTCQPSLDTQPDVPISGIRLSDWFHREARSGAVRGRRSRRSRPRSP
jgi:hypothetical protein